MKELLKISENQQEIINKLSSCDYLKDNKDNSPLIVVDKKESSKIVMIGLN